MLPAKLELDKKFQPCPLDEGDEAFPNGISERHFRVQHHSTAGDSPSVRAIRGTDATLSRFAADRPNQASSALRQTGTCHSPSGQTPVLDHSSRTLR
jgi:hypothetical protein